MELNPNSAGSRLLATAAIAGLAGCGIYMNGHFGWSLGQTPETKVAFTAMSVCFDVAKIICLPIALMHLAKRAYKNAIAAGIIWAIAVCYGLVSAFGFAATERAGIQQQAQVRNAAIDERAARLATLARQIEDAKLAKNEKGGNIYANSGSCLNATKPDSVAFCNAYLAKVGEFNHLTKEHADAGKIKIDTDPQLSAIARATGMARETIGDVVAMGMALVLEVVTSLAGLAFAKTRTAVDPEARQRARATREARKAKAEKVRIERRRAAKRRAQAKRPLVAIQGGKK